MYCDFENNDKSYIFVGKTEPDKNLGIIDNIDELRLMCARKG